MSRLVSSPFSDVRPLSPVAAVTGSATVLTIAFPAADPAVVPAAIERLLPRLLGGPPPQPLAQHAGRGDHLAGGRAQVGLGEPECEAAVPVERPQADKPGTVAGVDAAVVCDHG